MSAIVTRPKSEDLFRQMKEGALYRRAYTDGMSLSAWLDKQCPESDYKDGLDGFSRFLMHSGIVVNTDPVAGYYASEFGDFDQDDNSRALVPEYLRRVWQRVRFGNQLGHGQRVLNTSGIETVGSVMHPYVDAAQARMLQVRPAIPLSELIAVNTPISTDAYRAFYLTEPAAAEMRLVRIGEGAELPRVSLRGGDHTIRLRKYGRVLEMTYENLRRQRIDKVAIWVARVATQAEVDKVATVIDIILNGDGNSSTAATNYNLTTMDAAASAGTLTLKGYLNYKLQFTNPYSVTTMLVQAAGALQMLLLQMGSANVPLVQIQQASGFGSFVPINPELSDSVRLGITADAPTLKIVGLDRRFGIEQVSEIGADITETERWATRQTQALVLSEVVGYAVFDQAAIKTLNINA